MARENLRLQWKMLKAKLEELQREQDKVPGVSMECSKSCDHLMHIQTLLTVGAHVAIVLDASHRPPPAPPPPHAHRLVCFGFYLKERSHS